jgi:hypothetical protein
LLQHDLQVPEHPLAMLDFALAQTPHIGPIKTRRMGRRPNLPPLWGKANDHAPDSTRMA